MGDARTDDHKKSLKYSVEIIPQQTRYSFKLGQTIEVLCLLDDRPLANQFVVAGWESKRGKLGSVDTRTDAKGIR